MAPICIIAGVVLLGILTLLRRKRIPAAPPRASDAPSFASAVMFVLVAMSLF